MSTSAESQPNRTPGGQSRLPTGVLAIDPVPLFRDGLTALFERTPAVRLLGMTANMHHAVTLCERLRPDVVLLDSVLDPRCHLAQLLSGDESAMLSVVREPLRSPRYVATALATGVQGMVLRSAEPAQLLDAIRRTHLERRYLDPELAALAAGLGVRHTVSARQPLSRREYQVLQLISDGLENQAIAKSLFVSVETVRTHVKSILRKLHARDRAHAVAVAFRLGVLVPHQETDVPSARRPGVATHLPQLPPHGQQPLAAGMARPAAVVARRSAH